MKLKEKYEDYMEYLGKMGASASTLRSYRNLVFGSLSHSVEEVELGELKLVDMCKVVEAGSQHGKYGPQRSLSVMRGYLKFLKDSGEKLPFDYRDIKLPKVPHKTPYALSKEELEEVLETIPVTSLRGLRLRAMCEVMYATGLRIGEVVNMKIVDVPWATKETRLLNCKTGSDDTVYFTDRALDWVKKYLDKRCDGSIYLFVNLKGEPMPKPTVRKQLVKLTQEFESKTKKHVHPHLFRKTFVTHLVEGGADIKSVMYLARHKSERTTLHSYIALNTKRAKEFHNSIMSVKDQNVDNLLDTGITGVL